MCKVLAGGIKLVGGLDVARAGRTLATPGLVGMHSFENVLRVVESNEFTVNSIPVTASGVPSFPGCM